MVKMEEDAGRGITGSDITDQNILEIHAICKPQLQMRNMHHVVGNIEMDLSLEQLLASGKLFFNRACFNVPVHVCYCILDVFLFSSSSGLSELHSSHHMKCLLMVCCIIDFLTFLPSWFSKIQRTLHLVDLPHIKINAEAYLAIFSQHFPASVSDQARKN